MALENTYTEIADTYSQGFEAGKRLGYVAGYADAVIGKRDLSNYAETPNGKTWVLCELCDENDFGTTESLTANGWSFGNGNAFCPTCAEAI